MAAREGFRTGPSVDPILGGAATLEEVQHAPRVVDDGAAEQIAVVPGAQALELPDLPRAVEQRLDLALGEPERRAKRVVEQGVDGDVVEPREDALASDSQDPRHDATLERRVVLQPHAEEVAEEVEDLLAVAVRVSGVDRAVVLVDQHDHALPGRTVKELRQSSERALVVNGVGGVAEDRPKLAGLELVEGVVIEQAPMLTKDLADRRFDLREASLVGRRPDRAEADVDDRIALKVGAKIFAGLPHGEVLEQTREILFAALEEVAQHSSPW
jgi:hypothetical protein